MVAAVSVALVFSNVSFVVILDQSARLEKSAAEMEGLRSARGGELGSMSQLETTGHVNGTRVVP
jgi:hypothetical protein